MRFLRRRSLVLNTDRLQLRLPESSDYARWSHLRASNRAFLEPWEPTWLEDHLSKESFQNRLNWVENSVDRGTALPFLMFRRDDDEMIGGITLDQIRFSPAWAGNLGYWVGEPFSQQGFMKEAILSLVHHAFVEVGLSRIEAACLPTNRPSRGLLEKTGFRYEGVAQSYLEIAGRWRTHVLYANLRSDRRGRVESNY